MKTFTTYAEKKAKQFFNLLQGYTKGIRLTAILILLLMGVSNAWGSYVGKDVVIYMNNSVSQWSYSYIYFGISYNDNYTLYQMTKVNNTQLYAHKRTDNQYNNYSEVVFFAANSSWGNSGGTYSNMQTHGANLTYTYNNYDFAGGKTYAISLNKKGAKTDGQQASITPSWLGDSNNGINYKQTLKAKVSTDDGSNYSETTTPAKLTASSYTFTAYNSCDASASATLSAGSTSSTFNAGYTANTTLTATEVAGYTFTGWYSGSTLIDSELSVTVNPTGETTYYAYYKAKTYTVTLDKQSGTGGTSSVTATYGVAMPTITPPTRTGYTFGGYYTGQNGTGTQYYTSTGSSVKNWDKTSATTLYAKWTVTQYTINYGVISGNGQIGLNRNGSNYSTTTSTSKATLNHGTSISFTATPNAGYEVEGWYSDANCTQPITVGISSDKKTYGTIQLSSNMTVYVKFREETRRIYLKPAGDTQWTNGNPRYAVYIKNNGSSSEFWGPNMTKIDDGDTDAENDIYYADILKKYTYVIFCRMSPNSTNDWNNRWTQTKDLQILDGCNLFDVAKDASTENNAPADGEWMAYNEWHLAGGFNDWDLCGNNFTANMDGTYTYTQYLNKNKTYSFKLVLNGNWYGNTGNMTRDNCTSWTMDEDNDCQITADMDGEYIFTIEKLKDGNPVLTVTYPTTGYQLKITMESGKVYTSNTVNTTDDILSFFAPGSSETGNQAGTVDLYEDGVYQTTIDPSSFTESGVYVAKLNSNNNGITDVVLYTGDYYIRTWGKNGDIDNKGWSSVQEWDDTQKSSRKMTYFVSRENEFYNHYWVQTMDQYDGGKDVSGCVANIYNDDLAGKLTAGKGTDATGDVRFSDNNHINVRFGYDPRTNYFGRAIIKGSGENQDYLNLHCDNAYSDAECTSQIPYGTSETANKFRDISNWVYEREIYVPITADKTSASIYVEATAFNGDKSHLLGYVKDANGDDTETPAERTVIGEGTDEGTYLIRVVYDFKTNRFIAAWSLEGTLAVNTEKTIHADVLFVRKENNDVPQIELSDEGAIRSLESMFFALELERGSTEKAARHEEQYWFTLPFDCVVGSISGVHGYMEIWGIQRYNGKKRAEIGWFIETPTFWEWLSPNDTLKAGEGYLLAFDKKNAIWEDIEQEDGTELSILRLYFPSITSGFDLQQQSEQQLTVTYPDHTCTITYKDRNLQDSNWKVIGTTSYNNAGVTGYNKDTDPGYEEWEGKAPDFRYSYTYEFDTSTNERTSYTYTPELGGAGAIYKSFFGYMVQFAGTITWQPIMSETVPEGIAARRYVPEGERTSYMTRLEIANAEGEKQDQTFVALNEEATTSFDQNKDLNKVMNSNKANIYTLSEDIPFAGNTLPMEKATVPVGVRIATAGEYTFRMPDGTDGISVFLIDNQTGAQTNMLLDEYTVTLDAGTCENRFYLAVDPDRTATSVENIGEEAKGDEAKGQIKKFLIDSKLFIRTADGIFDAKGQRM